METGEVEKTQCAISSAINKKMAEKHGGYKSKIINIVSYFIIFLSGIKNVNKIVTKRK